MSDKIPTIRQGAEMEQKSVIWEIKNFHMIRKEDSMINAQQLEIIAGDKIGQSSKWTVFLHVGVHYWMKWIGIYYALKEGPATKLKYLVSQCSFAIKDDNGETIWCKETDMRSDIILKKTGCGIATFMLVNGWDNRESVTVQVTLKLYGPTNSNCRIEPSVQVEQLLEQFQLKFTENVGNDMGRLLREPMPGDVKVMSSDRKKEFTVPRGILAVRSPVLEAMVKSNLSEANEGVICLSDLSDKTLDILLNFIYTGKLLPEWRDGEVVFELTNAAAKYQLLDLLEFLDKAVGKVCVVDNALPLFTLATQLQLKTAEEELVKFVRENGANSVENLCEVLATI